MQEKVLNLHHYNRVPHMAISYITSLTFGAILSWMTTTLPFSETNGADSVLQVAIK